MDKDEALLVEYQTCQAESNSNAANYWILSGIFIGFSSVLLGGMVSDIFPNHYFNTIICIAMMLILFSLIGWLKRNNYLADRNYLRMREIELDSNIMKKTWRAHALDCWTNLKLKHQATLCDEQIKEYWNNLTIELYKPKYGLSVSYRNKLESSDAIKRDLVEFCNNAPKQRWYEGPSRFIHFPFIISVLIGVWFFTLLYQWFIPIVALIGFIIPLIISIFLQLKKTGGISIVFNRLKGVTS
jgi:hypothetical protein